MTALDILERCRNGDREIAEMESAISLRQDILARCGGQDAGMTDAQRVMARETDELQAALDRRRRAYSAELCAGAWIVDTLPMPERSIMRAWYLDRKSLSSIARNAHYSISSVKRLRGSGRSICSGIDMQTLAGFLPDWYDGIYGGDA